MDAFKRSLEKILNRFYPLWRSAEIDYDLGVPMHTLRRWVDYGEFPEAGEFELFIEHAFPLSGAPQHNITPQIARKQREILRITYRHLSASIPGLFDGEEHEDLFGWAVTHHNVGLGQCWVDGDYLGALTSYEKAARGYRLLDDQISLNGVEVDIAMVYWCMGCLIEAEARLNMALEKARQLKNYLTFMVTIGNLGLLYLNKGELESADVYLRRHQKLAVEMEHEGETARSTGNLGILYLHLDRYEDAALHLKKDIALNNTMNEGSVCAMVNLGMCYKGMKEAELAHKTTMQALKIAQIKKYVPIESIALRAAAECHPDPVQRIKFLCDALLICKDVRLLDEAGCLLSLTATTLDPAIKMRYWRDAEMILYGNGAERWLKYRTPENVPFLPML